MTPRKWPWAIVVGALCGAAVTVSIDRHDVSRLARGLNGATAHREAQPRSASVAAELATYRAASALGSADAIMAALGRNAALPPSPETNAAIEALLTRLASLDHFLAVDTAQTLLLDARFLATALQSRADEGGDSVLAALPAIAREGDRLRIAAALLDFFDAKTILAALPLADRDAFRVAVLVRSARSDPRRAFEEALALYPPAPRRRALDAVASAWARAAPMEALAYTMTLPVDLRDSVRRAISAEWARLDPEAFLRAVAANGDIEDLAGGVGVLLAGNPAELLSALEGASGSVAGQLRTQALRALAEIDPAAAMSAVEGMPPGNARSDAIRAVAATQARHDPDATLAWAKRLGAPRGLHDTIVRAVADAGDIGRALTLGIEGNLSPELPPTITEAAMRDTQSARTLATLLKRKNDTTSAAMLEQFLSSWAQEDFTNALDWMRANDVEANATFIGRAARGLAIRDASLAAEQTERLPPEIRSAWMPQVAAALARSNPDEALRWLERYSGQPGYDAALRGIITQTTAEDPSAAASILERAAPNIQVAAVEAVTSAWMREDPASVAAWVSRLRDPRVLLNAAVAATQTWAPRDAAAAEAWVVTLPQGATRDQALLALLPHSARAGTPLSDRLLKAFSALELREDALARVIPTIAIRDAAEARRLIEAYIGDPVLRQQLLGIAENRDASALPAFPPPR